MLETLRELLASRSARMAEDDFLIRALWSVDYRSQPNAYERFMAYGFLMAQTVRQGCCYVDFGTERIDHGVDKVIGQDARTTRGDSIAQEIAILDAAWGVLPRAPHRSVVVDGPPATKSGARAELVVDEALRLLPTGRRPKVANIGVMGTLVHHLLKHDVEVTASDFDEELVAAGVLGVPVRPGSASPELVAECDVAVVCGETLVNDTLAGLVDAARASGTRLVLFSVTGCHFAEEYCRTFGVDAVVSEPQPQYLFQGPSTLDVFRR